MSQVKIEIESPIFSRILKGADLIKTCLSFTSEYFQRTQFRTVRKEYKKNLIKGGIIYTGWIDRIEKFCSRNGLTLDVEVSDLMLALDNEVMPNLLAKLPAVEGFVELRPEQMRQVSAAIEKRRGYIVAPMGLGKTIEFMAILKAFEKYNCLVSVPGISILSKTIQDLKKFQFKNVNQLGEGQRTVKKGISVATMQTLRTLDLINLSGFWDVFIGDELHLAVKEASTYEKILSQLLCPIRLGFTATFPKNEERALIAEGIIGPIINQISFEESESLGVTMKPKIEFITIPFDKKINELRKFPEIYKEGIVTNTIRSRKIIAKAKELIEKRGKTVLIFSSERSLEHGQILLEMAIKSGLEVEYVRGETKGIEREKILKRIENKELKIVIATRVWREGINIRSLGGMINAKGGKAEEGTGGDEGLLQGIGRLLRTCEGLDEVVYVDCLDPYRYLSDHTVSRIALYVEMGWM